MITEVVIAAETSLCLDQVSLVVDYLKKSAYFENVKKMDSLDAYVYAAFDESFPNPNWAAAAAQITLKNQISPSPIHASRFDWPTFG